MATSPIHRILVPVDLSSCSRAAFELACSMSAALGAKLEVLFVQDASATDDELAPAREELHRFVHSVSSAQGLNIVERVERGDARERIIAVAEGHGFDMIVLGTHGRTGRPRSLAGSVAESVVRTAACPVVTVREPR